MDLPTLTFNLGTHACICNLFICRVLSTHSHAYFHFGCFLMHIMLGHFKTNTSQASPTLWNTYVYHGSPSDRGPQP